MFLIASCSPFKHLLSFFVVRGDRATAILSLRNRNYVICVALCTTLRRLFASFLWGNIWWLVLQEHVLAQVVDELHIQIRRFLHSSFLVYQQIVLNRILYTIRWSCVHFWTSWWTKRIEMDIVDFIRQQFCLRDAMRFLDTFFDTFIVFFYASKIVLRALYHAEVAIFPELHCLAWQLHYFQLFLGFFHIFHFILRLFLLLRLHKLWLGSGYFLWQASI